MYCPSCGTAMSHELNYCNRCGGDLSFIKGHGATKPPKPPDDPIGEDIFWTTVVGLGLILGGVVAMKALNIWDAFIIAYMILSSLAFIGLYALDFWRFVRFHRGSQRIGTTTARAEKLETKELDTAPAYALPEPLPSITEDATRAFEPSYKQQKTR